MAPRTVQIIPRTNPNRAPRVPTWLADDKVARAAWTAMWHTGVSTTWDADAHELVARLASLRSAFERTKRDADACARLSVQLSRLEDVLLLTPAARLRAGMVYEAEPKDDPDPLSRKRAELQERLRTMDDGADGTTTRNGKAS